jgi:hypothetical protein
LQCAISLTCDRRTDPAVFDGQPSLEGCSPYGRVETYQDATELPRGVIHQAHVDTMRLPYVDPISTACPGNGDLVSSDSIRGGTGGTSCAVSASCEEFVKGSPDIGI